MSHSILEIRRGEFFSLPEPSALVFQVDESPLVNIENFKIKGDLKMELTKEFLDERKAELNKEFNTELQQVLVAKKSEVDALVAQAAEEARANFVANHERAIADKYSLAHRELDKLYAFVPTEPETENTEA